MLRASIFSLGMVGTVHSASLRNVDLTTITDYEVTHSSSTSTGGNAPTVTGSFMGGSNDNYNPTGATGTSDATSDATGATKLQQEIEEIEQLSDIAPHDTISREEPTISLNQAVLSSSSIEPTEESYTPIEAPSQTLEGYSPNEAPSQTTEPVLINPTISSTSTSADHTDPIIDEPSDSDPQVQIQLNQYNKAQSELNRYNTAGKVLQQRVKVAEKNTMEAREKAEQRIQQDLIHQHARERGLDYQAKSTLPEGEGSWMPYT